MGDQLMEWFRSMIYPHASSSLKFHSSYETQKTSTLTSETANNRPGSKIYKCDLFAGRESQVL